MNLIFTIISIIAGVLLLSFAAYYIPRLIAAGWYRSVREFHELRGVKKPVQRERRQTERRQIPEAEAETK